MAKVFNLEFSELRQDELVRIIARKPVPPGKRALSVVTANLDHIVQLRRRPDFRAAYEAAWVATVDGMPVHAYAKLRGAGVPERVTGSDLFKALMPRLNPSLHRCVFVASSRETGEALLAYLKGRGFKSSALLLIVPPFGFEKDAVSSDCLAAAIAAHRPTHVFFGVGAPKSEVWTHRHRDRLGDCYVLNIGAALEFFVGAKRRAPMWMQRAGLEWCWRLAQEPRRLFSRYFVQSWGFVGAIRDDLGWSRVERSR